MKKISLLFFLISFIFSFPVFAQKSDLQWRVLGKLNNPRHFHQASYLGNSKVLVMGGRINSQGSMTGSPTNICEIIDVRDGFVTISDPMHSARAEFVSLVAKDSSIIVISGVKEPGDFGELTPVCERFNRSTGKWEAIGNLLIARRQHTATFINDSEILVLGGREKFLATLDDAEIFNINTGTSRSIKRFPYAINLGFVEIASNGDILAGAGRTSGPDSHRDTTIYKYSPTNDEWTKATQTSDKVHQPSVLKLFNGKLLFTGGSITENTWNFSKQVLIEENGLFAAKSNLINDRTWHVSAQWNSDSALVMSGYNSKLIRSIPECEWINVSTGQTSAGPPLNQARAFSASVSIPASNATSRAIIFISGLKNDGLNDSTIEILERPVEQTPPSPCTKISGVINRYTAVTQIANSKLFVTVSDATGFKKDDQVLFVQMQGAEIDPSNTISYGTIKDIRGAGDYEFAVIEGVNGNTITFTQPLKGMNYDVQGKIQLVSVPTYSKAIVRDTLTAAPWNGMTGGILALSATCLSLEGTIDASGKGFRGGSYRVDPCNPESSSGDYVTDNTCFANKGEGIAGYGFAAKVFGRGAPANGGGGGNSHNGGGGGGSNAGRGGKGGFGYALKLNPEVAGGLGGTFTSGTYEKLFLGGGGGAGQVNNGHGSAGGNGGGIIFINAGAIENKVGYSIISNGITAANDLDRHNPDGCGGGGAGGTILINAKFKDKISDFYVSGGHGGNRFGSTVGHGTGGGGGGGMLISTNNDIHTVAKVDFSGGSAGNALEGGMYGATAGQSGKRLKIDGAMIPGVLKTTDSVCQGCYPIIETAQQLCSPATFIAKDDLYQLQIVELDESQSENITMTVSGALPADEVTGTFTLKDPSKPGSFVIRAVNKNDNTATYSSQVYPKPVPVVNTSGANLSVTGTQAADALQWFHNGTAIQGATGKNHKAVVSGEYHIEVTNIFGCKGISGKILVNVSGVEDDFVKDDFFTLYPNPASDQLVIESRQALYGDVTIEITNILGETAFKANYTPDGSVFKRTIQLDNVPHGTFYVHISSGIFKKVYKIVRN